MFEVLFGVILSLFALGGLWAFFMSRKVRREGIETTAVISRIEEYERPDLDAPNTVSTNYYISYTHQTGDQVEALLGDQKVDGLPVGSKVRIKYHPDRQEYPVLIEIL